MLNPHRGRAARSKLWASLVAQRVKNLPVLQETWVWSLVQEDPLEKGMATHSSILAWRTPWREEPGKTLIAPYFLWQLPLAPLCFQHLPGSKLLCHPLEWSPLGQSSQRLGKTLRAPYSLLSLPLVPLSTWDCQGPCDPSSCTASIPGPPWGKPKSSRAASGAMPYRPLTCRGADKTTIEIQG